MKLLWLDTETTGLCPVKNALREIGFIYENEKEVNEGLLLINPLTYKKSIDIDSYALEISNKTLKDLETYPDSEYSFYTFCKFLDKRFEVDNTRFVIAGFNAKFDYEFLKEWFKDNKAEVEFNKYFHYKILDVFSLVFILKQQNLIDTKNDKLETVCNYFDIPINAHDALSDIEATKKLYDLIVDRFIKK